MTKLERIQTEFKGVYGPIDLYIDATRFHFIDVDTDRLDGLRSVTASCGCCGEYIDHESELSYELEYMHMIDYEDLIAQLRILKEKMSK